VIAGCGEVTRYKHLRALKWAGGVVCAGLLDPDGEALRRTAASHGLPLEPGEGDALLVATPPEAHLAAAQGSQPVLVEKPLSLSREDAAAFVEMARDRVVVVGFHMRHHRLIVEARRAVEEGQLGVLESVHVRWSSPREDAGLPAWRFERRRGGGALWEIGVHAYDLWRHLTGAEVESVFARAVSGTRQDEFAEVTARLSGGILATASLSERAPHQIQVEVRGARGRLEIDCLRFEGYRFYKAGAAPGDAASRWAEARRLAAALPGGLRSMRRGGDYLGSYLAQWRHFRDAALGAAQPMATATDGAINCAIARAAAASAETGALCCPEGLP
jgi:predicted dehydrogenase